MLQWWSRLPHLRLSADEQQCCIDESSYLPDKTASVCTLYVAEEYAGMHRTRNLERSRQALLTTPPGFLHASKHHNVFQANYSLRFSTAGYFLCGQTIERKTWRWHYNMWQLCDIHLSVSSKENCVGTRPQAIIYLHLWLLSPHCAQQLEGWGARGVCSTTYDLSSLLSGHHKRSWLALSS